MYRTRHLVAPVQGWQSKFHRESSASSFRKDRERETQSARIQVNVDLLGLVRMIERRLIARCRLYNVDLHRRITRSFVRSFVRFRLSSDLETDMNVQ